MHRAARNPEPSPGPPRGRAPDRPRSPGWPPRASCLARSRYVGPSGSSSTGFGQGLGLNFGLGLWNSPRFPPLPPPPTTSASSEAARVERVGVVRSRNLEFHQKARSSVVAPSEGHLSKVGIRLWLGLFGHRIGHNPAPADWTHRPPPCTPPQESRRLRPQLCRTLGIPGLVLFTKKFLA